MWKALTASFGMIVFMFCVFLSSSAQAADEPAGQKIFLKYKCTQCHSIDALKIGKVESEEEEEKEEEGVKKVEPPDLSGIGNEKDRTAEWIIKWEKKEEKIEGRKHKKKFKGSDEELKTMADWLVTLKFDVPKKKASAKPAKE